MSLVPHAIQKVVVSVHWRRHRHGFDGMLRTKRQVNQPRWLLGAGINSKARWPHTAQRSKALVMVVWEAVDWVLLGFRLGFDGFRVSFDWIVIDFFFAWRLSERLSPTRLPSHCRVLMAAHGLLREASSRNPYLVYLASPQRYASFGL